MYLPGLQTPADDLTTKGRVKENRMQATSSSLGRNLCPLEWYPPILFSKRDLMGDIYTLTGCTSHHKQVFDGWIQKRLDGSPMASLMRLHLKDTA